MTRPVTWDQEALDDLAGHVAYVGNDSPSAARRIARRVREVGDDLGTFAVGRSGQVGGTYERVLHDLPYTIVYSLDTIAGREVITILRVMHQAQQWPPVARPPGA